MLGQSEKTVIAIFVMIIGILGVVAVLRSREPLEQPQVKALQFANEIASMVNALYLEDGGQVEIDFKDIYDVDVEFRQGNYFVKVSREDEAREAQILFYPSGRDDNLVKSIRQIDRICITKDAKEAYPEVAEC